MDEQSSAGHDRKKRWVVAVGSVAVTSLFVYLAFLLGAWGFDARRFGQHQRRMQNLLRQAPQLDQVEQAFQDEGTLLLARAGSPEELKREAAQRGGPRATEIVEKGAKWPVARVFLAGDMVYFVFFDAEGVMRDFVIASR
jgi:hypothetical protein